MKEKINIVSNHYRNYMRICRDLNIHHVAEARFIDSPSKLFGLKIDADQIVFDEEAYLMPEFDRIIFEIALRDRK